MSANPPQSENTGMPPGPGWTVPCARWTGAAVALVGAVVLMIWWVHGSAQMVPNTAIGFALAGLALWLLAAEPVAANARRLGLVLAGGVALLGLVTVAEYLFGWDTGLDRLAFAHGVERARPPISGRPSILSAVGFALIGLALALVDVPLRQVRRLVEGLTVVPIQIALLALIGHICGVPSFYGWKSLYPDTAMPALSAVTFTALGGGLLAARPDRGLMQVLTGHTAGSLVARRLLLAPVVIPLATGLTTIALRRLGTFNLEFVSWSFSFLNIFFFTVVIWWVGALLHGTDGVRRRAEVELREANERLEARVAERTRELAQTVETLRLSERRFRALIEHGSDSVALVDANNRIIYLSPAVETVEGYAPEELLGRSGLDHTHPEDLPLVQIVVQRLLANPGQPIPVLWRRRHKDGRWLWLEGVATNLLGDPAVAAIVTNYRDVTERRAVGEKAAWLASFPERNPHPIVELSLATGAVHYANPAAVWLYPELPGHGPNHGLLTGLGPFSEPLVRGVAKLLQREVTVGDRTFTQTITYIAESGRLRVYSSDITARQAAEEAVRRQADELRTRNAELERFSRASAGRELRMIELKREVNALARELGRPEPHALDFLATPPVTAATGLAEARPA